MKILFVHPSGKKIIFQDLYKEFSAIEPPIWSLLLAYKLREYGHDTSIYNTDIEEWCAETALNRYHPDVIIIIAHGQNPSASTQLMPAVINICKDLKNLNSIKIIVGGNHASALPEKTLCETGCDWVIRGMGVEMIDEICNYFNRFYGVRNALDLPDQLDTYFPNYAWDLITPLNNYRAHNWHCFDHLSNRSPYVSIYTSLGCPHKCTYCSINAIFDKPKIRYWSEAKVLEWIDELVNHYHIENIKIADELFMLDYKRVHNICDMLIERKYNLNFWCYGRIDTIDRFDLQKLKRAGINWISLGIESANADIQKNINKKLGANTKGIVKKIQENGISVAANYIFGLPGDNIATMNETKQLAIDINAELNNFYCTMPYPGSLLYKELLNQPNLLPENNGGWIAYSQYGYNTFPLKTDYLTNAQILKFRDETFYQINTSDTYLSNIEKKFGHSAVEHIQAMASIQLKRKLYE